MATTRTKRGGSELELQAVTSASESLRTSISNLIATLVDQPVRPSGLSKTLGINKDIASRVVNAISTPDPLASVYAMPGPSPLRSLVRSAKRKGAPADLIEVADRAIDAFERMLVEQIGDKTGLNALIGAWLPEARQEVDATARQLMYRGSSLVKGLYADVAVVSFLLHRAADTPDRCDTAMIGGWVGLCRIRPRVPMRFVARLVHPKDNTGPMFDAAGDPFYERFLQEFSDQPLPVTIRQATDRREYWLDDRGVGPRSSTRVFVTERYKSNHPFLQPATTAAPLRFFYAGVDVPVKTLILDVFLAEDVWPGVDPELRIYDTAANGVANPNDPSRDLDMMEPPTSIYRITGGIAGARSAIIPNYPSMLESVLQNHGWSASAFRGYRCQIDYPMYSSQICQVFNPFPQSRPRL